MKRSLSLLAVALLGMAAVTLPWSSRAATLHESDYVRISVPDLPQAVSFFRNVLDCQLVGTAPALPVKTANGGNSQLMACETGSIVELYGNHGSAPGSSTGNVERADAAEPVQFVSGNIANADQWLRAAGVRVIGAPQTLRSGPFAGMTVVTFVSPWGLRLQLVGWDANVAATGQ